MKNILFLSLIMIKFNIKLALFFIGLALEGSVLSQTNHALVVTIGEYPLDSGWESIHSNNDKQYILEILSREHFLEENITTLSDSRATKRNVTEAFRNLVRNVEKGDAVFVHFSCHGQQMMDDNGDEPDGWDESLVLYDAKKVYISKKYEGENHLRDDELGIWINELRKKSGDNGRVTVVLDACHSGTANRGEDEFIRDYKEYVRGTTAYFAPKEYVPIAGRNQHLSLLLKKEKGLAEAVVISACLPEENNYEYYDRQRSLYVGKLTFVLHQQVLQKKVPRTVGEVSQSLLRGMFRLPYVNLRLQHPYVECSDENVPFFIGKER